MINLELYYNYSEPNVLLKTLQPVGSTKQGYFVESVNIMNPVIRVEGSALDLKGCNYIYIKELKRYYFVQSITAERSNITILYCYIDVLNTYCDSILTCEGLIRRAENDEKHNKYLNDPERQFESLDYHIPMLFEDSTVLTPKLILLTTCGLTPVTP